MGIQEEIQAETRQYRLTLEQEIQAAQDRLDAAEAILKLADNKSVKKWVALFVDAPLEQLEVKHDLETRTNENFILKGQVFRLKKQQNWKPLQKKKVEELKEKLSRLRERTIDE